MTGNGGNTGLDKDIALRSEAIGLVKAVLSVDEWQPLAAAVLVELRDVEDAVIQQALRHAALDWIVDTVGDVLVGILEALVIP